MPNTITNYYSFSAATKAKSAEINTNFANHRGDLVPINSDTATASDQSHDLGSSEHRWRYGYMTGIYPGITTTHSTLGGTADEYGYWTWNMPTNTAYFRVAHNSITHLEIAGSIATFYFGSFFHDFTETYARFPRRIYFDSNLGSNFTYIGADTAGYIQINTPKTSGAFGIVLGGTLKFLVGINGVNGTYLQDGTIANSKREADIYDPTTSADVAGGATTTFTTLLQTTYTPTANRLVACELVSGLGLSELSVEALAGAGTAGAYFQFMAGATTIGAGYLQAPTVGVCSRWFFSPHLKSMHEPVASSATTYSFQYKSVSGFVHFNFSYLTLRVYEI